MKEMKMRMAGTRMGRVVLHLICLVQDGKVEWHKKGIVRELVGMGLVMVRV